MSQNATSMSARARCLHPSAALAGCIHLAFERNTLALDLTDRERLNFYPASPFPTVSWLFTGEVCMIDGRDPDAPITPSAPLAPVMVCGPQRHPTASWAAGPIHALTVSFYPDAWAQLLGVSTTAWRDTLAPLDTLPPTPGIQTLLALPREGVGFLARLETALAPWWQGTRPDAGWRDVRGWLGSTTTRLALSPTGASLRQAQRRFRDWTGQSRRELALFARVEEAFARRPAFASHGAGLAMLAHEVGYSDQSHLGREVRRVTGFSPAEFQTRVMHEEAFWLYRLLNEQLRC